MKKPKLPKQKKEYLCDGIKFDSSLEIYCYKQLKHEGLTFNYHPDSFILLPPFVSESESFEPDKRTGNQLTVRGRKLQPIKYTTDFAHPNLNWIIEVKGLRKPDFDLRWKLFKKYLNDNGLKPMLFLPRNQSQVNQAIQIIKRA